MDGYNIAFVNKTDKIEISKGSFVENQQKQNNLSTKRRIL